MDTGHHAPETNIERIVAFLLREQKLGAYDRSRHDQRIVAERVGGAQAGWGA